MHSRACDCDSLTCVVMCVLRVAALGRVCNRCVRQCVWKRVLNHRANSRQPLGGNAFTVCAVVCDQAICMEGNSVAHGIIMWVGGTICYRPTWIQGARRLRKGLRPSKSDCATCMVCWQVKPSKRNASCCRREVV